MSTAVRESGSKTVGQFVIPYKGTWQSIAANMLTPDQLYDSMNVFIRKARLKNRPGLSLFNDRVFEKDIIGGVMVTTPTKKILLAFSSNRAYRLLKGDTTWDDDTTISIANDNNSLVDLTFLETASQYVCIIANGESELKKWIDGEGVTSITATIGTVPIAKSVCTAASRIIALVNNHTVVWTSPLSYTEWGALNYNKKAAETNDAGICIKSLNDFDFVIYKERSIYLAKAQAGANGRAFAVQMVQRAEGPAGVHAVVDGYGPHIYMSVSGRIAVFDGSSYVRWIADGLWFFLQDDIDPVFAYKIFGVFDYHLHTITFYYPKIGDGGKLKGMVIINIPLDGSGITDFACFLGYSSKAVSYGFEMRFDREPNKSILFTSESNNKKSFLYDEAAELDDDSVYNCMLQTGLLPMPDMKHNQVSAEIFIQREDGNGSVDVSLVSSDSLENESGSIQDMPSQTVDLEFNPVQEYIGFNQPCRFVGLRLDWVSTSLVKYTGAVIYGREVS